MADPAQEQPREGSPRYTARLLIDCADRPGIVAAVSGFLFERGANIVSSHQYSSDPTGGRFFLRTEFFLAELRSAGPRSAQARERLRERFGAEVAERFQMDWELRFWGERRRVAILVSRHDHCLVDLLWRWRRGELEAEVVGGDLQPPRPARARRAAPASPTTTSPSREAPGRRPRSGC